MLKLNKNDRKHVEYDQNTDGMDCDDTGTASLTDISCKSDIRPIKYKFVVFRNDLSVTTIPNRWELGNMCQDLWWSKSDFCAFKNEANSEVYECMQIHQFNLKESLSYLYQPPKSHLHVGEQQTNENSNAVSLTRDPFDEIWFQETLDTLFMDMEEDSFSILCMNTA